MLSSGRARHAENLQLTTAPSFPRIFVFAVAVITLAVALQSPGNAVDRIDLTKLKPLNTLIKCEGCDLQHENLKGPDLEEVVETKLDSTMQIPFTHREINGLDKRNSTIETQYAQNSEMKQNVDDSRAIFLRLLKNPADLQLNILYAKNAEERGKINLAIVTYQRMILLDPNNKQWKDNIERLRDLLRPPETTVAAVLGTRISTNAPLNPDGNGNRAGYNESIVVTLDHKRRLGGLRYQATGQFYADYNVKDSASDLILAGLQFGPLLRISTSWQLRPALLFDRSSTDRRKRGFFSYSAGTLFNFVNLDSGPIRIVDISLYHVGFNNETAGKDSIIFTSSSGLEYQGLKESDQLILTPNITFNRARGGRGSDGFRDLYYELGFEIEYVTKILENLEIGPLFSYYYRDYIDYEPGGSTKRDDQNFNIGLQSTAINIIPDIVILATYSFERNKSNLANETYRNHSIGISFVKSF